MTGAALTLAPNNGGTVQVTISGASSAPTNLGLGGTPCVNVSGCVYTVPGSGGVGFEFLNVTSTGALLVAVVTSTLPASATPYSIPITIGSTTVGTFILTVPLTAQTISFGAIPGQAAGGTLALAATASSGLAVTYAASPAGTCTVSGSTASLLAAGTCTITASQAGNATYAAATPVAQSFAVGLKAQSISFAAIPAQTAGGTLSLTATASSGLVVTFSATPTAVCTVAGNTLSLLTAGTCSVVASQTGNATYAAAPSATQPVKVNLASQTISFAAISAQTAGGTLKLAATASSGLAVTYAASPAATCTVSGSTATLVAAGTCAITASQPGNAAYAAAPPVTQSFAVSAAAVTVSNVALTIAQNTGATATVSISGLSAAPANLGLGGVPCVNVSGCTYTVPGGGAVGFEFLNVTNTSALMVAVATATLQPSATPYSIPITIGSTAVGTFTLTVPLTAQTIAFGSIAGQMAGGTLALSATASSGLAVSYASGTTGVCTVSGSTASFVTAGTCTITASQAGNATYAEATPVSQSFAVSLKAQSISFGAIGTQAPGGTLTLSATASSGLAVAFASTTASVCTVSGTTASFLAAGTCSITASQPGNAIYSAAAPVTQQITVLAAVSQTITFAAIPDQTPGASVGVTATASSGLPVAFAASPSSICTVSGNTVSLVAVGTCSVVASQTGNATYAAAPPVTQLITVASITWTGLGPVNILSGVNATGVSGTCSDALYMAGNPNTIMMSATHNNSAPGIKVTTDGGATWSLRNSGLPDMHITALATDLAAPNSYFAASGNGVFHTSDNAATWQTTYNTSTLGGVNNSFFWIQVAGVQTLVAATMNGVAYQAVGASQWTLTQPPSGAVQIYNLSGMVSGSNTILYASVGLNDPNYATRPLYRITVSNGVWTWTALPLKYITSAVDPANPNHVVGSADGTYLVRQSFDGGMTDALVADSGGTNYYAWFVNFDDRDTTGKTYLVAGNGFYYRTTDGGNTFVQLQDNFTTARNETISIGTDVQRLIFPANQDTLLCSDQGLFIFNYSQKSLVNRAALANNSIVVSAAVSHVSGQAAPNLLTTLWDWAPAASWDGGQTWPASANGFYWYADNAGTAAPLMGEGGQVYTMNSAADGNAHVVQEAGYYVAFSSADGGFHFTQSTLPAIATSGNFRSFVYDSFSSAQTNTAGVFKDSGVAYLGANEYTSSGQPVSGVILTTASYGVTWTALTSPFNAGEMLAGLAVDPNDSTHLIVSTSSRLLQSHDTGQTWTAASLPGNTQSPITQFSFRRGAAGVIVALNTGGEMLQTQNGGTAWSVLSPYTAALAPVLISYSPTANSLVVVASSAYPAQRAVLLSHDNGATWKDITGDIQTTQINRAAWDVSDLYLATSGQGILRLSGLDSR